MRDGVGDVPDAVDELLDLIEHPVDGLRELVELVRFTPQRQPMRQVAVDDGARRLPDAMYFREQRAPDQPSSDCASHGEDARGAGETVQKQCLQRPEPRVVAPDEQIVATGKRRTHEQRPNRAGTVRDGQLVHTWRVRRFPWPGREIARERREPFVGE